jgi:hypothetical protein
LQPRAAGPLADPHLPPGVAGVAGVAARFEQLAAWRLTLYQTGRFALFAPPINLNLCVAVLRQSCPLQTTWKTSRNFINDKFLFRNVFNPTSTKNTSTPQLQHHNFNPTTSTPQLQPHNFN